VNVLTQIALVAVGSALGGLARWGVGVAFEQMLGVAFPWGTLFINLTGSLFLGWFTTMLPSDGFDLGTFVLRPDHMRLTLAVGFTGAYTTFSTFELESHDLLKDGDGILAMLYVVGSVLGGLLAVRAGAWLAGG
jgi:CrcB protein